MESFPEKAILDKVEREGIPELSQIITYSFKKKEGHPINIKWVFDHPPKEVDPLSEEERKTFSSYAAHALLEAADFLKISLPESYLYIRLEYELSAEIDPESKDIQMLMSRGEPYSFVKKMLRARRNFKRSQELGMENLTSTFVHEFTHWTVRQRNIRQYCSDHEPSFGGSDLEETKCILNESIYALCKDNIADARRAVESFRELASSEELTSFSIFYDTSNNSYQSSRFFETYNNRHTIGTYHALAILAVMYAEIDPDFRKQLIKDRSAKKLDSLRCLKKVSLKAPELSRHRETFRQFAQKVIECPADEFLLIALQAKERLLNFDKSCVQRCPFAQSSIFPSAESRQAKTASQGRIMRLVEKIFAQRA